MSNSRFYSIIENSVKFHSIHSKTDKLTGLTKGYKRIRCLGFGRFSWKVTVKVTMKFS